MVSTLTGGGGTFHSSISPLQQKQIITCFGKQRLLLTEDAVRTVRPGRGFQKPCKKQKKWVDKLGLTEYHPKLFEN